MSPITKTKDIKMREPVNITCPVSSDRINENAARTASFLIISSALIGLYTHNPVVLALLAIDFALRAFTSGYYSPIKLGSKQLVTRLGIKNKPVDAAPKRFAAGLGMVFCLIIGAFQVSGLYSVANITGSILLFCAFLEGALGICLGCIVYSFLILPLSKR